MANPLKKTQLRVNGQFVGYVKDVEYTCPVERLPDDGMVAKFTSGSEVTINVQLDGPFGLKEGWRLVTESERAQAGDQRWSPTLCAWLTVVASDLHPTFTMYQLVRRKALVFE